MAGCLEDEVRTMILAGMPELVQRHGWDAMLDPVATFTAGMSRWESYAMDLAVASAKASVLLAKKIDEPPPPDGRAGLIGCSSTARCAEAAAIATGASGS